MAICLERFGVERVYSSPVRLGSGGFVSTQHGAMPIPTPATLEILRDYPTVFTTVPHELTTPTGAAIIKALSSGTLTEETITVQTIGYGAGTKEIAELPNMLRVVIGDLSDEYERDELIAVETNIDDMNPQVYPYLIEKLLASGAHDAYLVPIIMKKGRPGILLSVLASKSKLDDLASIIYTQTSTIGLRIQHVGRRKLLRREVECQTSFGSVR
ncbi:MAG: LarC family nickel insertion protein, partial [Bacteroidota bacterium]